MDNSDFVRVEEAIEFMSEIPDPISRSFVEWAINLALFRPAVKKDFPSNKFDLLYYSKLMLEISQESRALKKIMTGQASDLW